MTVVGTAEVVVTYDSSEGAAELKAKTEADLAGLSDTAAVAGTKAGEDLKAGVKDGSEGIADDLANTGALAGVNLREGIGKEADGIAADLGKVGEDGGEKLATGLGSKTGVLASALGALGVPVGEIGEKAEQMGGKADAAGLSIQHMASNAGVSEGAFLAGAGGIAVLAGGAIDLGVHMQEATDKVANAAQISDGAAKKITDSFSGMAGHSEADGAALATAYAGVAGQLGSMQGRALTAAEAVKVMTAAQNLGEATSTDLATSTSSLASVMQAYQVPVKDAAKVSDQLYVASQRTGLGVAGLSAAAAKVKTGLGDMAPPLSQVNGLLVDMADHGETGRKGLSLLTTAMTTLVKPAADMAKAQDALKIATDQLPPSLKNLAAEYDAGKVSGTQLTAATDAMSGAQSTAWAAFIKASTGMTTAKQSADALGFSTVNAQGKFIGMGPVLDKLHDQIKGMSDEQATAKLTADGFGSSAAKLLTIVQAGPKAFDDATAAVTRHGAAADAAAKQQHTLDGETKTLITSAEDLGEDLGGILVPALTDVVGVGVGVVKFVSETPPLMYALGAAVGIGLGVPVARFAVNTAKDFIGSLEAAGQGAVNFGAKLLGQEPVFAATQTAEEQTAAALTAAAESMSTSAAQIAESMSTVGAAAGTMATEVAGQAGETDASFAGVGAAAGAMATEVEAGMAAALGEVTATDTEIKAQNELAGASFADLIPGVGLVAGIAGLAGAFLTLGGNESSEASAAQQVTKAKNAEATAVTAARDATVAQGNAYFAVKNAQQQVTTSQETLSAAIKKYGADSTQVHTAILQEHEAKFQLVAANTQLAESTEKSTKATEADATAAQKRVDVTTANLQADQKQVDSEKQLLDAYTRSKAGVEAVTTASGNLKAGEAQLTVAEQAHQAALASLASQQDVARAGALALADQDAKGTQLTQAQIEKVQGLSGVYKDLPKTVQTQITGDTVDAQTKISGVITQLEQAGVGKQQIVTILGNTTNATQAVGQLTQLLLATTHADAVAAGEGIDTGLASGIDGSLAVVSAAGARAGQTAIDAAKAALKSHSPSLVFYDIGTDVGAGFAQGLDASTGRVADASGRLVKAAVPPSTPTLEAAGARGTARAASHAASPAMVAAEQAWVTAAQTVTTNLTNAATAQSTRVTNASTALSAAASKVRTDSSALKTAGDKVTSDSAKVTAAQAKVATDESSAATKTEKAGLAAAEAAVKTDQGALKTAKAADSTDAAAKKLALAADATKAAADKAAQSSEAADKEKVSIASRGQSTLNSLISAITSGSQQQLSTTMSGITQTQMEKLVSQVTSVNKGMAAEIETAWQQGMDALAQANEIAANTAAGQLATDTAKATAQGITDAAAVAADVTTGASAQQLQLDQDTQSSDATIGQDQETLDQAAPGSLAQSQDQLALSQAQAAQTVQLAKDNAALTALTAATTANTAATTTNTTTTTAAVAAVSDATAPSPTYVFNLTETGMTPASLMNEAGWALTIGTLPPAAANPALPVAA